MSYDVAVWYEAEPITFAEADAKADKLWEDDLVAFTTCSAVTAFHRALLERFPRLEDLGDDFETLGVWSVSPQESDAGIIMCVSWSKVDIVRPVVESLAAEHDLLCYDPQRYTITLPPRMAKAPRAKMSTENGSMVYDPDPPVIRELLRSLNIHNAYAILERAESSWYIQTGHWEDQPGWLLEYREGTADRHYGTKLPDPTGIDEAFEAFARGDMSFRDRYTWAKVDL